METAENCRKVAGHRYMPMNAMHWMPSTLHSAFFVDSLVIRQILQFMLPAVWLVDSPVNTLRLLSSAAYGNMAYRIVRVDADRVAKTV